MAFLRRRIIAFAVLVLFLAGMASCSENKVTALELFNEINKHVSFDSGEMYTYLPDTQNKARNTLLSKIYSDGTTLPPEISLCDDYLIIMHNGNTVYELHIFCAVSAYDTPKLEDMLISRRDRMQSGEVYDYVDEESSERIASAMVITVKEFVILAVTDENSIISETVKAVV